MSVDPPGVNQRQDSRAAGRRAVVPRALLWLGGLLLVPYAAMVLMLYLQQEQIIFPGHARQGQPETHVEPAPGEELLQLRSATGDRIAALFGGALTATGERHPDPARCPTLLYFYGNGMSMAGARSELQAFRRLGVNVLVPDLPGYGMSSGRPGEKGCYAAADAAYEHLVGRKDIDPALVVVGGWSLGAAVAADLATRKPVAGLVALCTFTSMGQMAQERYPYLPVSLFLRHRFETERKLKGLQCPIFLAHGTDDTVIPPAHMDHLARAAGGPVTRFLISGADHNDFFDVGGEALLLALRGFLYSVVPARRADGTPAGRR